MLLNHDCVIIPQFGAFVARTQECQFVVEERLFLPPTRTVHFNMQIRHNDTLLTNSLRQFYKISEQEADRWCQEYIEYIQEQLVEYGTYDFGSIGVFQQEGENIRFIPCTAGISSPCFYGLDSFQFEVLSQRAKAENKRKKQERSSRTGSIHTDDKHFVIRVNKSVASYVATIAASIILFLTFTTPVENATNMDATDAELFIPSNLIPISLDNPSAVSLTADDIPTQEETVTENAENTVPSDEPVVNNAQDNEIQPDKANANSGYAVVLASSISMANAEAYTKSLQSRKIKAEILSNGKMTRVVIPGFDTREKAHDMISELKALDKKEFGNVWMLKLDK